MESEPAPRPLSMVDLALLRAARAFGGDVAPGFWGRFPADRCASLRWGWDEGLAGDPSTAVERLRREHTAQARPDLARIHVSWWVRALKDEPLAVQRAVAANLPHGVADVLRDGLELLLDDLRPDRPANSDALQGALALWTVRLVGDLPERDDDPPVIAALTRFDARNVSRLMQTVGLAKWSLTPRPAPDLTAKERARLDHFRQVFVEIDPRFVQVATREIGAIDPSEPHPLAHAGMTSFARLLATADPYRVRWALQHIPYATARSLRTLMGPNTRRAPMLGRWETDILRASWMRLHQEGWLPDGWGFAP